MSAFQSKIVLQDATEHSSSSEQAASHAGAAST